MGHASIKQALTRSAHNLFDRATVTMSLIHSLLIATMLACVVLTNGRRIPRTLKCTGKCSEYTDSDCQRLGDISACYYQNVIFKYMSCARICDGVEVDSADEERCREYCPGCYRSNCTESRQLSLSLPDAVKTTQGHESTTVKRNVPPTHPVEPVERMATDSDYALYQLLIVIAVLIAVICVGFAVVTAVCCYCKREGKLCCFSSSRESLEYTYVGRGQADADNQRNISSEEVYPSLTVPTAACMPEEAGYEKSKLWINAEKETINDSDDNEP